jgi:hypothetical protein
MPIADATLLRDHGERLFEPWIRNGSQPHLQFSVPPGKERD